MTQSRKLAAILAADVVGYSRLMEEDETGTARVVRERREAAAPILAAHGGRLFKTMGDGMLIEFPSIVSAVECALAMQKQMAEMAKREQEANQKMADMQQKRANHYSGPQGLLVFHSSRSMDLPPGKLLTELGTNIVQSLLVVFLLGQTSLTSFAARWRFATVAGVLAAISTNISYYTFYGFPGSYTVAYICSVAMGFVCAGLVVVLIDKPRGQMPAVRSAAA